MFNMFHEGDIPKIESAIRRVQENMIILDRSSMLPQSYIDSLQKKYIELEDSARGKLYPENFGVYRKLSGLRVSLRPISFLPVDPRMQYDT